MTKMHHHRLSLHKSRAIKNAPPDACNAQNPISQHRHLEENHVPYSDCNAEPLDHLPMFPDFNLEAADKASNNTNCDPAGNNSDEEYNYFADMSFWPKPDEIVDYHDELVKANGPLSFTFHLPKGRGTELQDDAADNENDSFGIDLEGMCDSCHTCKIYQLIFY